ncbi:hypothetical protein RHRU231_370044 [Rhodococcus ruber]|uniref:Uncharacterized protein n=1 Tax=Rhodococcus ruber TaxID=1830 RepID=A0A098BIJ2_9NOCA|nr:hypothetical protein RHRU231_370044 [Rhodococcus ruber]
MSRRPASVTGVVLDRAGEPSQQRGEGVEFVVGEAVEHAALTLDAAGELGVDHGAARFGEGEQDDAAVALETPAFDQPEPDEAVGVLGGGGAAQPGDRRDLAGAQWRAAARQRAQHFELGACDAARHEFPVELGEGEGTDPGDTADDVDRAGVEAGVRLGPAEPNVIHEVLGLGGVRHGSILARSLTLNSHLIYL